MNRTTAIAMTHSIGDRDYADQIASNANSDEYPNILDNRTGQLSAQEMLDAPPKGGPLIGGGSAEFLLNPKNGSINLETPQAREIVKLCLFLIIQEIQQTNRVPFLGICFSAQALAVAIAIVGQLKEKGFDFTIPMHSIADMDAQLVGPFNLEQIVQDPGFKNPLSVLQNSETYIQTSHILQEDPILEGIQETYDVLHSNNQVILADMIRSIRDKIADLLPIDILSIRDNVTTQGNQGIITTQTATLFKIGKLLYGIQGHPDYRPQTLADGYSQAFQGISDHANYFWPGTGGLNEDGTPMSIEQLIEKLKTMAANDTTLNSWKILSNFQNNTAPREPQRKPAHFPSSTQPLPEERFL